MNPIVGTTIGRPHKCPHNVKYQKITNGNRKKQLPFKFQSIGEADTINSEFRIPNY